MKIFDKCLPNRFAFSISEMAKEPSESVMGGSCSFILSKFLVVFQREPSVWFSDWNLFSKNSYLFFNINFFIVFAKWLYSFLSDG